MKQNKNILYLVDDYILLYRKKENRYYKYKVLNKSLKNGRIANSKLFIKSYQNFIQKNKLNNNLFGEKITIIVNPAFTKVDIDILTNIFSSLNYRKINVINEMKIYNFNMQNAFINYNEKYIILSYINDFKEKKTYLIENNLLEEKELINVIKSKLQKRNIFLFGLYKDIDNIAFKIEKKSNNVCYHFKNDETYLIDELLV